MAHPTAYTIAYSFTDWQTANPVAPLPADEVDNELANIQIAVASNRLAIMDVRRADGALANAIVTQDSLAPSLLLTLTGYLPTVITETATFTVDADALAATVIVVNSASPVVASLPADAPAMSSVVCFVMGAGTFEFAALTGATLRNKYDWYACEGQYGVLAATVVSNVGGSAAVWVITGDVSP